MCLERKRDAMSPGTPSKLAIHRDISTFGYLMSEYSIEMAVEVLMIRLYFFIISHSLCTVAAIMLDCSLFFSFSTSAAEFPVLASVPRFIMLQLCGLSFPLILFVQHWPSCYASVPYCPDFSLPVHLGAGSFHFHHTA